MWPTGCRVLEEVDAPVCVERRLRSLSEVGEWTLCVSGVEMGVFDDSWLLVRVQPCG